MSLTMADRDGFIWFDGKVLPWREVRTHVLTHALPWLAFRRRAHL